MVEIFPNFYGRPFMRVSPTTGGYAHGTIKRIECSYTYHRLNNGISDTSDVQLFLNENNIRPSKDDSPYWDICKVHFHIISDKDHRYDLHECWIDFGDDYMAKAQARSIFKINAHV